MRIIQGRTDRLRRRPRGNGPSMPPATISTAVTATDAGATQDRLEPAPSRDPLLAIEGVIVRFGGVVALDGVSFDVARGAICGLIGPNGAARA